jgi:hypothetical protein
MAAELEVSKRCIFIMISPVRKSFYRSGAMRIKAEWLLSVEDTQKEFQATAACQQNQVAALTVTLQKASA